MKINDVGFAQIFDRAVFIVLSDKSTYLLINGRTESVKCSRVGLSNYISDRKNILLLVCSNKDRNTMVICNDKLFDVGRRLKISAFEDTMIPDPLDNNKCYCKVNMFHDNDVWWVNFIDQEGKFLLDYDSKENFLGNVISNSEFKPYYSFSDEVKYIENREDDVIFGVSIHKIGSLDYPDEKFEVTMNKRDGNKYKVKQNEA